MSCSYGGWTAGAGRLRTLWQPSKELENPAYCPDSMVGPNDFSTVISKKCSTPEKLNRCIIYGDCDRLMYKRTKGRPPRRRPHFVVPRALRFTPSLVCFILSGSLAYPQGGTFRFAGSSYSSDWSISAGRLIVDTSPEAAGFRAGDPGPHSEVSLADIDLNQAACFRRDEVSAINLVCKEGRECVPWSRGQISGVDTGLTVDTYTDEACNAFLNAFLDAADPTRTRRAPPDAQPTSPEPVVDGSKIPSTITFPSGPRPTPVTSPQPPPPTPAKPIFDSLSSLMQPGDSTFTDDSSAPSPALSALLTADQPVQSVGVLASGGLDENEVELIEAGIFDEMREEHTVNPIKYAVRELIFDELARATQSPGTRATHSRWPW
jgi:hypothetical protein